MNMVIVLEILIGLVVLGAAARFAVRDARQRRGVIESDGAGEAPASAGEREAKQGASEVVDQREGEEVATVGAVAADQEPPADPR